MTAPTLKLVGGTDTEGRMPPSDADAEQAVIAAVIIDPDALPKIPFLEPGHFFGEAHRRIFEAVRAVASSGTAIDTVTVGSWLRDRGRLDELGGLSAITNLLANAAAIANVIAYAVKVYDLARVRQTIAVCQRVAATGYIDHGDVQAFIDGATRSLADLGRKSALSPAERNIELLKRRVRELSATSEQADAKRRGIATGIPGYDVHTGGLHSGQKTTVAALPGGGKSTFALQLAVNVARQGIGVLVFSQEMTKEELADRQLAMLASVDAKRIQARTLNGDEWNRLYALKELRAALPIVIDDTPKMNMHQVKAAVMAQVEMMPVVESVPLGLVILDYVQRLEPMPEHSRRDRHEQIRESSKALKNLCRELKIPGIELAQRKKPDPKEPEALPKMTDFAGCRDLADEADNIVFLHEERRVRTPYDRPGDDVGTPVRLMILKQRGGKKRVEVHLVLRGEFSRFDAAEPDAGRHLIPDRQYVDDGGDE